MLIDVDKIIQQHVVKKSEPSVFIDDSNDMHYSFVIKSKEKIEQYFGKLLQNVTYHFATAGRWSQFELMHYVLAQTGPAKVYFSTWKINNTVAANLFQLVNSGLIIEMYAILEKRIPVTSPEAKDLVTSNCVKYRICDNHSKVIVIQNDVWSVVINGSGNMTINPRIEAGIVCTKKELADFNKNWILNQIENGNEFKHS